MTDSTDRKVIRANILSIIGFQICEANHQLYSNEKTMTKHSKTKTKYKILCDIYFFFKYFQ